MGYRKYYKIKKTDMAFIVAIVFIAGIIFANFTLPRNQQEPLSQVSLDGERSVELGIPAVDIEGSGVTGMLIATVRPGSGQVLVSVNDVLAQFDTQLSARTAAHAASIYSKINTSSMDIIYTIKVNATAIEGPSAGSTMAVATVLALQNQQPSKNVMMTGSVAEDGTILPVGAIYEKAQAAKDVGVTLFLVPEGQSTSVQRNRVRTCKNINSIRYCKIEYESSTVNIGESLGITVKEVKNIGEAVGFYISGSVA